MSSSWTFGLLLILCCLVLCMALPKTESINYKVLNSHDKTNHKDCSSLLRAGYNVSGTYRLSLNNKTVLLPCEFRDGNAFTLILRRMSASVTFVQPWANYENGFGNPQGDFWAGLANIYHLTNTGSVKSLQINMQDWSGVNQNVFYSFFRLDQRETRYRLNVGRFSGNIPDDLQYQNQMPFSTYDAPDPYGCTANMYGGWWYSQSNYCTLYFPTGRYYPTPYYTPSGSTYDGMYYRDWHNFNYSLRFISWTLSG